MNSGPLSCNPSPSTFPAEEHRLYRTEEQLIYTVRPSEPNASQPRLNIVAQLRHSSPVVTKRVYDHHVRRSFSGILTTGLPLK